MRTIRWTPERRARLRELAEGGGIARAIAEFTPEFTPGAVRQAVYTFGIVPAHSPRARAARAREAATAPAEATPARSCSNCGGGGAPFLRRVLGTETFVHADLRMCIRRWKAAALAAEATPAEP